MALAQFLHFVTGRSVGYRGEHERERRFRCSPIFYIPAHFQTPEALHMTAARKTSAPRKLPLAPPEVPRIKSVEDLAPRMRKVVTDLLALRAERMHDGRAENDVDAVTLVFETFRTNARQKFLYGQGREYAGKIVTKAYDASWSWHGYGMAIDIVHPTKLWSAPEQWWEQLALDAEYVGLYPGRRFKTIPDSPHLQWRSKGKTLTPLSPDAIDRSNHRAGKTKLVWERYGLIG